MAEVAKQKDMEAGAAKFVETQKACINCHTKFRARIVKQFNNEGRMRR